MIDGRPPGITEADIARWDERAKYDAAPRHEIHSEAIRVGFWLGEKLQALGCGDDDVHSACFVNAQAMSGTPEVSIRPYEREAGWLYGDNDLPEFGVKLYVRVRAETLWSLAVEALKKYEETGEVARPAFLGQYARNRA
jgi:hypothetical protein